MQRNPKAIQPHSFYRLGDGNDVYCNTCKGVRAIDTGLHKLAKQSNIEFFYGEGVN